MTKNSVGIEYCVFYVRIIFDKTLVAHDASREL